MIISAVLSRVISSRHISIRIILKMHHFHTSFFRYFLERSHSARFTYSKACEMFEEEEEVIIYGQKNNIRAVFLSFTLMFYLWLPTCIFRLMYFTDFVYGLGSNWILTKYFCITLLSWSDTPNWLCGFCLLIVNVADYFRSYIVRLLCLKKA